MVALLMRLRKLFYCIWDVLSETSPCRHFARFRCFQNQMLAFVICQAMSLSSQAAKLLAEAAPEIRKMGFGIDLDSNAKSFPVMGMPNGTDEPVKMVQKKVYPNDPCPCGSGKKYKKCCGR